jgi:hypothetical protein
MKLNQLSGAAAIALVAMTGVASAALFTGSGTVAGVTVTVFGTTDAATEPSNLPFPTLNLGTGTANSFQSSSPINPGAGNGLAAAGISQITFPTAGNSGPTVPGSVSGLYAGNIDQVSLSPFGSTNSTSNYLTAQANGGQVMVSYSTPQSEFALLWGSVDNGNTQNLLALSLNIGGVTITGQDIANIISNPPPGANTPFANAVLDVGVVISNLGGTFTSVTATDNAVNSAYEFDPLVVPSPLIGHGLLVLLAVGGVLFGGKLLENSKKQAA